MSRFINLRNQIINMDHITRVYTNQSFFKKTPRVVFEMKDRSWSGNFIWGSSNNTYYMFDFETEHEAKQCLNRISIELEAVHDLNYKIKFPVIRS